jgi:hypothetical protein
LRCRSSAKHRRGPGQRLWALGQMRYSVKPDRKS